MVDTETFLTRLDVRREDCCHAAVSPEVHPGPPAALQRSAGLTLGRVGPGAGFPRVRACDRDARQPLRAAVPPRPQRSPGHRGRRRHHEALVAGVLPLGARVAGRPGRDDALARSAGPTREARRRGAGWGPGRAARGWRPRRGGSEGVPRRRAVRPPGLLTGVGVGAASPA